MRALILANGDSPSSVLAQRLAAQHDLLLATDGAAHRAVGLGITPDIVCGDFDSVSLEVVRVEFPNARILPTPEQEHNDLEKAILLAREQGATEITIFGAAGGRIDHTLASFFLLVAQQGAFPIRIVDEQSEVWAISGTEDAPGERTFAAEPGDTISLFTLNGGTRVTLSGVKWPLREETLALGTRGLSNVAEADQVTVTARGGALIVCHLHPQPTSAPGLPL